MTKSEKIEFDKLKNELISFKKSILEKIESRGENYYYIDQMSMYYILKDIEKACK